MEQQRQDDEVAGEAAEHGEADEGAEVDGGNELAGAKDQEADDESQGGKDCRPADALLNDVEGFGDAPAGNSLAAVGGEVVDGAIDGEPHRDGGDHR